MSEIVKKATRDGFGDEIVELGRANSNVLVVDVDIGKSCKTGAFRKELPAARYPSLSHMRPSAACAWWK